MQFRLTTHEGNFYSISQNRLNKIDSCLLLSKGMVDLIYKDIKNYPDDVQSHAILLRQMFFELANDEKVSVKKESVEFSFKEVSTDKNIDSSTIEQPNLIDELIENDNVVTFNKFKKNIPTSNFSDPDDPLIA